MQYPKECLGKAHTGTRESVCLWPMGPSLLPHPWALMTKKSQLVAEAGLLNQVENPTTASGVTSQFSAPPSPLLPHYSPLRSQLAFLWGQTWVGFMVDLPRREIYAASTNLPV